MPQKEQLDMTDPNDTCHMGRKGILGCAIKLAVWKVPPYFFEEAVIFRVR